MPLRPCLKSECQWGRCSAWRSLSCGIFSSEPGSLETGERSFPVCSFCHFTLVLPFHCANFSNCNTLSIFFAPYVKVPPVCERLPKGSVLYHYVVGEVCHLQRLTGGKKIVLQLDNFFLVVLT